MEILADKPDDSQPEAGSEPGDTGTAEEIDAELPGDAAVDDSGAHGGLDARVAADAQPASDARPASDAQPASDARPVSDADADASDAAQPAPGLRIVIDHTSGSADLSAFPVRVLLDTRTLIQQGLLAADCSNLRIFGDPGCGMARSFFLPAYACNSASSEIWLRVPQLRAGMREVFAVTFDATRGEASDGSRVFPFFDDFEGTSLDTTRWIARGQGTHSVSGGVLQSQGVKQLQSIASAVSAGQSIVGARLAALGAYDTDVELGVGTASGTTIWAPGRTWDGLTFVSYSVSTYAFDGPAGTSCDDLANSMVPTQLDVNPWLDTPPASATFLSAEFAFSNRSGRAEAWLRSSRGASLAYNAPAGCALPASLPLLITLDHNAPDAPTQRVDYVYVRPSASSDPSASLQTNSSLACGSAP